MRPATSRSGHRARPRHRSGRFRVGLLCSAMLLPAAPLLPILTTLPALARPAPDSFADLAARLLPSVVNISSTETVSDDSTGGDDDEDDAPGGDRTPDKGGRDPGAQTPSPAIPTSSSATS